jgi:hypothetical protein
MIDVVSEVDPIQSTCRVYACTLCTLYGESTYREEDHRLQSSRKYKYMLASKLNVALSAGLLSSP